MDGIEANRRSEDPRPITAPDNVNNVPNKLNIHTDSGNEIKPENVNQSICTASQTSGKILFESKPMNDSKDDDAH